MTLPDMHIYFRQYAQQMGMQNVRAITSEQIDIVINTSITDIVNDLIAENIGSVNDSKTIDTNKLAKINAFNTLHADFDISLEDITKPTDKFEAVTIPLTKKIGKVLFLINASVTYKDSTTEKETRKFPVRFIDNAYLADTLNDVILSPKFKSPIAVVTNVGIKAAGETAKVTENDNLLSLYFGALLNDITPYNLQLSAIVAPNVVKYDADGNHVHCNLPDYLHVNIIKHAVDLYRTSINNGLYGSQRPQNSASASNRPATENY